MSIDQVTLRASIAMKSRQIAATLFAVPLGIGSYVLDIARELEFANDMEERRIIGQRSMLRVASDLELYMAPSPTSQGYDGVLIMARPNLLKSIKDWYHDLKLK